MKLPTLQLTIKNPVPANKRIKITDSKQLALVFRSTFETDTIELNEQFKVLYLNRANHVLGVLHLSTGSVTACLADIRHIISAALLANATQLAICHNHPSGVLEASKPDMILTDKVKQSCRLFDLTLIDHIILTADNYYSFSDNGI